MAKPLLTFEQLRRSARDELTAAGIDSADFDTKLLISEAFGLDASALIANARQQVAPNELAKFKVLLDRRLQHEPIAYLTGLQPFWSLEFKVTPDVLIPRPETEGVVERALTLIKDIENPVIADVGTGSGAILLSLLHEREDATGIGLDISEKALKIAQLNANKLELAGRINIVRSYYLKNLTGRVDMVVSNPPYITDKAMDELPQTVSNYEPDLALRGGEDGLSAYVSIVADLSRVLSPGGHAVFEIGYDQGEAVSNLLVDSGMHDVHVQKDLAGHDRIVSGKLSV